MPCLLLLTACDKLVEVDYPANQVGTEQVFEDLQTANAALSGLYAGLRDESVVTGAGYYSAATLLASYSDELDYYNNSQGLMDIYQNQQLETNSIILSIWKTAYRQVYNANSVIYGAEHSKTLSETDKNYIVGEAIFIRSLLFFYLQQIFGDIPYTISLDYVSNSTIGKTWAETVLDNLVADLTRAISLLDDEYRNEERIYPNRKAAQLLLAHIYLMQEEWLLAQSMAETILESPMYVFQTDINEVFHSSGTHILWQIKPENSGDAVNEAAFYYFSGTTPKSYALTDDLVNTFTDDDLRKQLWMVEETFNGNTWYRPCKYKNTSGTNYSEYSIVLRLEEAYFIKAEALARQERFDDALTYLNATRERAGLTALTSLSGEEFFTALLEEKRREFFCEFGLRFFDLKRFGRLNELVALKPNWEDYMNVWPLPQSELLLNPNMSPQNTGY